MKTSQVRALVSSTTVQISEGPLPFSSPSVRPRSALVLPVLELSVQRGFSDAQELGCLLSVAPRSFEHRFDMRPFHRFERGVGADDARAQIGRALRATGSEAEVTRLEELRFCHDQGSFHRVLELPDVAGPSVSKESLTCRVTEPGVGCIHPFSYGHEERPSEGKNILRTVPQGGDMELHDAEPVKKVFAKSTGFHR